MESPTHVGNTGTGSHAAASRSVHPHACGEYPKIRLSSATSLGSSPRVWGIPHRRAPAPGPGRFIPTRVGNTNWRDFPRCQRAVHPHACGEYCWARSARWPLPGSSPRVWGIRQHGPGGPFLQRFIPTRVGNTAPPTHRSWFWPVHPHACGEYLNRRTASEDGDGSSPRVWGILDGRKNRGTVDRFIPTRVGNTRRPGSICWAGAVHPHACGEYLLGHYLVIFKGGSSPRVWGIRRRSTGHGCRCRFIPTRVGNTFPVRTRPADRTVHPHACGEYSSGRCKK